MRLDEVVCGVVSTRVWNADSRSMRPDPVTTPGDDPRLIQRYPILHLKTETIADDVNRSFGKPAFTTQSESMICEGFSISQQLRDIRAQNDVIEYDTIE